MTRLTSLLWSLWSRETSRESKVSNRGALKHFCNSQIKNFFFFLKIIITGPLCSQLHFLSHFFRFLKKKKKRNDGQKDQKLNREYRTESECRLRVCQYVVCEKGSYLGTSSFIKGLWNLTLVQNTLFFFAWRLKVLQIWFVWWSNITSGNTY